MSGRPAAGRGPAARRAGRRRRPSSPASASTRSSPRPTRPASVGGQRPSAQATVVDSRGGGCGHLVAGDPTHWLAGRADSTATTAGRPPRAPTMTTTAPSLRRRSPPHRPPPRPIVRRATSGRRRRRRPTARGRSSLPVYSGSAVAGGARGGCSASSADGVGKPATPGARPSPPPAGVRLPNPRRVRHPPPAWISRDRCRADRGPPAVITRGSVAWARDNARRRERAGRAAARLHGPGRRGTGRRPGASRCRGDADLAPGVPSTRTWNRPTDPIAVAAGPVAHLGRRAVPRPGASAGRR